MPLKLDKMPQKPMSELGYETGPKHTVSAQIRAVKKWFVSGLFEMVSIRFLHSTLDFEWKVLRE